MKTNTKIIILSVIVIILALSTFYYLKNTNLSSNLTGSVTPSVQPTVQTGNTSDTQLNGDLNTVDSNLKNLDTQNAQVDAGINQTPVDPSQ